MTTERVRTLPASSLYWAVVPRRPRSAAERRYAMEEHCPLPAEHLHVIARPLDQQRTLLIGCHANLARSWSLQAALDAVVPEEVPGWAGAEVEPARLNLLQRPFASAPAKARSRRRATASVVLAALIAASTIVGIERRIAAARSQSAALAMAEHAFTARVFGNNPSALPLAVRLEAESRRLDGAARATASRPGLPSAAQSLASTLGYWRPTEGLGVSLLAVGPDEVRVQGEALSPALAQEAASRLGAAPGWNTQSPSVTRARDAYRYEFRLRREGLE